MMRTVPQSPATIVFCDVVGFSKYDGDKQQRIITSLNAEVTKELFPLLGAFGSEPKTVCLPTGDGLLIVMFCGWDPRLLFSLIKSLRAWSEEVTQRESLEPECRLRVGVHVGKVSIIPDINRLPNVCGDDINTCRRIMDQARPNQVLFSIQAHEAYIGNDKGTFSSSPFSGDAPVEFTPPMTITVKHNVQLTVRVMTQRGCMLWTGESPISAPAVIEGDGCVRTRTKLIIEQLQGLLRSDQKKIRIYEQATFSTFGIASVMEEPGFDSDLIYLLQQQKQAFDELLRARCCEVKVILRPIPAASLEKYPEVAARYQELAHLR